MINEQLSLDQKRIAIQTLQIVVDEANAAIKLLAENDEDHARQEIDLIRRRVEVVQKFFYE